MTTFNWVFKELYAKDDVVTGVKYLLTAKDDKNSVETEGNHTFSEGSVTKKLPEILESDIKEWIEKDTTIDEINAIKSGLQNQLNELNNVKKVDFPWEADTFTIE